MVSVKRSKIAEIGGHIRGFRPQGLFLNAEGSQEERLGLGVFALVVVDGGKITESGGNPTIVAAKCCVGCLERFNGNREGFGVLAFVLQIQRLLIELFPAQFLGAQGGCAEQGDQE